MIALTLGTSALGILVFNLGGVDAHAATDAADVAGSSAARPTSALPNRYTTCEGGTQPKRPPGRPRTPVTMPRSELLAAMKLLGGIKACARAMGCAETSMARYVHGHRAVPHAMATELREAVARMAPSSEPASVEAPR